MRGDRDFLRKKTKKLSAQFNMTFGFSGVQLTPRSYFGAQTEPTLIHCLWALFDFCDYCIEHSEDEFNCLAIKLRLGLLGPLCKNIKFFVLAEESVDKTFWKSLGGDEVAKHSINKM